MTRVTVLKKGESITGFECRGHAGYAEQGKDIVCAAISALTTTCVNALETVAGIRPAVTLHGADMTVALPDTQNRDAQVILRAMLQGLSDIAAEYPAHLTITRS